MDNSWITIHRKLKDSHIYKDSQAVHLWLHLLLSANHKDNKVLIGNSLKTVLRGCFLTGRKKLSTATGINESKIERLLKLFEKESQIEQQKFSKYRIISITNYDLHQASEQQMNSKWTASEQQVNTNNNVNNVNNVNKREKRGTNKFVQPSFSEVSDYCNERKNNIDPESFISFYESKGWMIGKNKMKSWKACISTWEKRQNGGKNENSKRSRGKLVSDRLDELAREAFDREGIT